MKMAENIV